MAQASHEDQQKLSKRVRPSVDATPIGIVVTYKGDVDEKLTNNSSSLTDTGPIAAGQSTPALAQPSNAAELCTPDVMRLCNEFVPDVDRITACMQRKRGQLSPACSAFFKPKRKRREH